MVHVESIKYPWALRSTLLTLAGGDPMPAAAISKLLSMKTGQGYAEFGVSSFGTDAAVGDQGQPSGKWAEYLLAGRATTIYGGTSEVQLNIISKNKTEARPSSSTRIALIVAKLLIFVNIASLDEFVKHTAALQDCDSVCVDSSCKEHFVIREAGGRRHVSFFINCSALSQRFTTHKKHRSTSFTECLERLVIGVEAW